MPSPSASRSTPPRQPPGAPASPPRTSPRTFSDTRSQCACKLRESEGQPSRCCSVTNPRRQRVPTSRPTSNSGNGPSTAQPRPAPAVAGTRPKTNCSPSSRPCDYAELCGQVTAPASGNTPARPGPRHNGEIGIIIDADHRVVPVGDDAVPFAVQGGERLLRGLLQAGGGHLLPAGLVDRGDGVIPRGVCLFQAFRGGLAALPGGGRR